MVFHEKIDVFICYELTQYENRKDGRKVYCINNV